MTHVWMTSSIALQRKEFVSLKKFLPSKINVQQIGKPASPNKTSFFKFCWWNGGGKIKLRFKTNPELRKFLSHKPDIFGYGETGTPSSLGLSTIYIPPD